MQILSQEKNGTQQTSNEKIESNPLAKTIVSMINAMQADYGLVFTKQFSDPEILRNFKQRLYQKLKGLPLDAIIDGYELCTSQSKKFCPTVPEILSSVLETVKQNKKKAENQAEVSRLSALPAPKAIANPSRVNDLLRKAMQTPESNEKERIARLKTALKNHEVMISVETMTGKVKTRPAQPEHGCSHSFCQKTGTLSHGVNWGGNFYCGEHFAQTS